MVRMLQPLLGVSKSNPLLEVLIAPDRPDDFLIHFGMHHLETVRRDPDSVLLKMAAGRFYNAGFDRNRLVAVFPWGRKSIQRFGDALKTGDIERITRVLSGNSGKRKMDRQRERFVRETFRENYATEGCHINRFIREKFAEKYDTTVSRELLRPIINEEKDRFAAEQRAAAPSLLPVRRADEEAVVLCVEGLFRVLRELQDQCAARRNACTNGLFSRTPVPKNCKYIPSADPFDGQLIRLDRSEFGRSVFVHHAGLLLVRADIDRISAGLPESDRLRQWLGAVLCGAVNIEQSGALNFDALAVLVGPALRSAYRQRLMLHDICDPPLTSALWRRNAELAGAVEMELFLYDPHSIRYTGEQKILLGWLGNLHMVTTVYFQDFIHTEDGVPLIAFLEDNYEDVRDRFPRQMAQFRQLLWGDATYPVTVVVDRAIYNVDRLRQYRELGIFVITWQKGGGDVPWCPPDPGAVGEFAILRHRNNSRDTITHRVEYYCEPWDREPTFSCHTVRLSKGDEPAPMNVAVLCTDPQRDSEAVLRPILRRWLQENDLLYGIANCGLNQITSYKSVSYEKIAETLGDRQVANRRYRRLVAERLELRRRWGLELVKRKERKRQAELFIAKREQKLERIEEELVDATDPEPQRSLRRARTRLRQSLRQKEKREENFQARSAQREQKLTEQIAALTDELKQEPEEVSRLEQLIQGAYRRLNFGPKALFDSIRINARNIFGRLHARFRPCRDNYRNDHRLLRELIRAPGVIIETRTRITVSLIPARRYQPVEKKAVQSLLEDVGKSVNETYREKPVQFRLQDFGPSP